MVRTSRALITLDLPAGDSTLVAKDFPLTLDASSLRVEGEAAARLTIGAIDTRPPRPVPPANLSEIDKHIEALKDERANWQGAIAAAEARRKFAERFAEASPAGLGEKGEARPLSEWRAAFGAVSEEVAAADTAIRDAQRKQRDIDRNIARLESDRAVKPPAKLEVRIDLAAQAATKATLRVTYAVRNARWTPLYDARLDTGTKDRKPALELVRRAEITQSTGEDWSNVVLGVSTVRTARGGSAPELGTLVVQYPQPPRPLAAARCRTPRGCGRRRLPLLRRKWPRASPRKQQAEVETSGFQVTFKIADASASAPPRAQGACASRRRRSRPIFWFGRCRSSIRPRSSKRASSRPRTRRCCRAGSRSTATALLSAAAGWPPPARTRRCGSALAPTTRSRSSAPCSSAAKARRA
jgi:uncharacterized protein (TIGR02231 family)